MADDELLEILFWWDGGDSQRTIEAGLEDFLEQPPPTRPARRLVTDSRAEPGTL